MKLRMLRDRVAVVLDAVSEQESTLLYVPDSAKKKAEIGTVAFVGPGKENKHGVIVPVAVSVGDRVLVAKGTGQSIIVDKVEYVVLFEADIVCKV